MRLLVLGMLTALAALAQHSEETLTNPFTTEADATEGKELFQAQCASCHGKDGRGGASGPDLGAGALKRASTDEGIYKIIMGGIPGTTMPAFGNAPGRTWKIVTYIRSLTLGTKNQKAAGDAAKGAAIYSLRCAGCHEGAAPDLTGLGQRRALAEIRKGILEPNAEVAPPYWSMRAVTKEGKTLSGVRLNEDTFSVQYRTKEGRLGSVRRSDLQSIELDRKSPMPSFEGKLSATEIDDVLAFIVAKEAK